MKQFHALSVTRASLLALAILTAPTITLHAQPQLTRSNSLP